MFGSKSLRLLYDIGRGINATIWEGLEGTKKVSTIVKSGLTSADIVIGGSHYMKDVDVGFIVGNFPSTN